MNVRNGYETRLLQHFLPVAHSATRRMLPVCEQLSHHTRHCTPTAMVPTSSHRVSFRHLCWDPEAPWLLVFLPGSGRGESSRWAKHGAELCLWLFLAGQRMLAERIHHDAAGAAVSLADCTTQAETDGYAYGVVVEVETAIKALVGRVWSQSPLWGAAAANNFALWYGSL